MSGGLSRSAERRVSSPDSLSNASFAAEFRSPPIRIRCYKLELIQLVLLIVNIFRLLIIKFFIMNKPYGPNLTTS